jgi:hypothetical protein
MPRKARNISTKRISTVSTTPPEYPQTAPIRVPVPSVAATTAIEEKTDAEAPASIRE